VQAAAIPSVSPRATYAQRGTNTLQYVFRDHFACFAADYDSRYAKELGNFRIERISRVSTRFLACGDYRQGVARIRCSNPECRREYFRPFSCRGFHLCPSCRQRSLLFSEYLDEHLLLVLPYRQFVFTPPKALRVFLRHDQRLFGLISRLIFSLIADFYSAAAGKPISSAAVLSYQPFGDALRFNPHSHALILEGGFDPQGQFYFLPIHVTARLTQLLRQRTVGLFLTLGLITAKVSETLLCWRNSGFCVDNSVRLDGGDHTARQALAQYEWSPRAKPVLTIRAVLRTIARAPLSLRKITYDRSGGKILYHTTYNPYFKQNTNLWTATDFIAHLTQFIPPWGVRYILYYGLYSSRCKARWLRLPHVARVAPMGWRQYHEESMSPQADAAESTTASHVACLSAWARLIVKVYEIDPLVCPECGAEMRRISIITNPAEVRTILRHLVKIGRSPPGLDASSLN
jgi:hypothetical protein